MNFRLFEFEDKAWLPDIIREGMTDYLSFILNTGGFYEPVALLIMQIVNKTNTEKVIDLCSGGGGAVQQIQKNITAVYGETIPFVLTDKFPNLSAFELIKKNTNGLVSYLPEPLNAAGTNLSLKGARTIFSAFHHFDVAGAKRIIGNAVAAKEGIGIFDGGDKNLFFVLCMTLFHPIAFFLCTPFLKPFKWSRLLLTYIFPVIPFCTMWDGIVSIIRLYKPQQLKRLAVSANSTDYYWQAGKVKNKFGMRITYLIGYPL
jgi:hypothetical protein